MWSLIAVPVLIAMNAFFVAAEYAVVAIRPQQIDGLRQRGRRGAAAAVERLKADPASAIGAIQVCITMTNLLLGWIGEPAMSALLLRALGPLADVIPEAVFTPASFALSFVIVTLLTVVFSELLPKALTLRYVIEAASFTAVAVLFIGRAIRPLVWVMNTMANAVTRPLGLGSVDELEKENVTIAELRLMATQAGEQGVLPAGSSRLVLNSLALSDRRARDIMVPRVKVAHLDLRKSMDENRRVMNAYLFTRLPLTDGGMDKVVGIVPTKEFLAAYNAEGDSSVLSLIAHPPVFVPQNVPLDRLLEAFHEHRTQMAFLVDEYGGVAGIVTLQDVVDELVGEIGEGAAPVTPVGSGSAGGKTTVPGDLPLHDLARTLGRDGWGGDFAVTTVGGLVTARLRHVPRAGEAVEIDGVRFRVIDSTPQVVKWVEVEVLPPTEPEGGATET